MFWTKKSLTAILLGCAPCLCWLRKNQNFLKAKTTSYHSGLLDTASTGPVWVEGYVLLHAADGFRDANVKHN